MAYHISRNSVLRNMEQLEQLLKMRTTLKFPTDRPRELAHKLREAIESARKIKEFNRFSELKTLYKFRVMEGSNAHVLAEFVASDAVGIPPEENAPAQNGPKVGAPIPEKKTIPDAESLVEVLLMMTKFKNEHEVFFPNAIIEEQDKIKILEWANDKGWKYIDHEDGGLTLTKQEVPEEVLFTGEGEE